MAAESSDSEFQFGSQIFFPLRLLVLYFSTKKKFSPLKDSPYRATRLSPPSTIGRLVVVESKAEETIVVFSGLTTGRKTLIIFILMNGDTGVTNLVLDSW